MDYGSVSGLSSTLLTQLVVHDNLQAEGWNLAEEEGKMLKIQRTWKTKNFVKVLLSMMLPRL